MTRIMRMLTDFKIHVNPRYLRYPRSIKVYGKFEMYPKITTFALFFYKEEETWILII
jgi:hypothetical protein